jgi:hypothetical protein
MKGHRIMATCDFTLAPAPTTERLLELWLQHAAGLIIFEDVRGYALERLGPNLDEKAREVATKAIDDAIYGLMMVLDGVTGSLRNSEYWLGLKTEVYLKVKQTGEHIASVDLLRGDGMCMGYHRWLAADFGEEPKAIPK